MFKNQEDEVAVLGVCVDKPALYGRTAGLNFVSATSGRRALELLRMVSFDFALIGMKLPDQSTWDFLRMVRTGTSHLKWALVGGPVSEQQEITARMFGATTLFDTTPTTHELLNIIAHQRRRAIERVLTGQSRVPAQTAQQAS